MILQIFTVFDSAAKAYLQPFFAPTTEMACRQFREVVNQRDHQFNKFPEDYTLFRIGEFDQESGLVFAGGSPHSLGVALMFMEPAPMIGKAVSDAS